MPLPHELISLHLVAESAVLQFGGSAEGVFDPCGLILELPPARGHYWCTPTNVVTFASTGGDGVHYSYLSDPRISERHTPIVMTLPCASEHNVIVAETFGEFFALGYYVGWFSLEQLVYQPDNAIAYFGKPNQELDGYAGSQLAYIRDALKIRPEPSTLARIQALNEKYHGILTIPELPAET